MRKQIQVFWPLAAMLLVLGIAILGSRLNAQQAPRSPGQAGAQAQEPQPGQQPGQPTQQPGQQPEQPGQAPGSQAGQTQGTQTFTGVIVKSGDKYVLQDASTGTTYDIDHQDLVSQHVGRKVRVNGTLDPAGKTIHLQ